MRLERCRGIGESERHHAVLEVTILCAERRFLFVSRFDLAQIVRRADVKLRVNLRAY